MTRATILILFVVACGGAAPAVPSAPAAAATTAAEPAIAPRPFTAEQIRDATPAGTEVRYRVEEEGKPTVILAWRATAVDAETVTSSTSAFAEDGTPFGEPKVNTNRWDELVKHATFPAAETTSAEGSVEVPAGTYETLDYVVTRTENGSRTVATFRFARALPGPPVFMTLERDGQVVRRMTLLSRT